MKTLILSIIISICACLGFGAEITNQTACVSNEMVRQIDKHFFVEVTSLWTKTTNKLGLYQPKGYGNFLNEINKLQADIVNTDKYDTEKIAQLKIRFENLKVEAEAMISTASNRKKIRKMD